MASSSPLSSAPLSLLMFVTLAIIASFFVSPSFSTSRGALQVDDHDHHHQYGTTLQQNGLRITLKHVDSGKNLTKFERLQRAMKRSKHRLHRLSSAMPSSLAVAEDDEEDSSAELVESQVHAGNGEFLMELSIGTPPESFSAIMDTGSDLIWTQCKPCKQCFDQPTPIFDPKKSTSFSYLPCTTKLCKTLPQSTCDDDGNGSNCEYLYSYGDYSSTVGLLSTETFTFGDVSVPGIGFGCGENNQGSGFTQGAGLVGLGRGPLSLVSQLGEPKFSYCLTSIDDTKTGSALLMGSLADHVNSTTSGETAMTTPLIQNPSQSSFYYLSLQGITVGDTRLPIKESTFALQEDGSGGMIIDSGTTITYIEESAFKLVKNEFISQTKLKVDSSGSTGLDLCFTLPPSSSSSDASSDVEVPSMTFHFEGADLKLPGENYMIADSSAGLVCLAMGSSNGMSIFGNVQQQNMLVIHDLEKETLSFVPTQCNQL